MTKLTSQEKETYKTFFDDNEGNGSSRWLVSPNVVERFISQIKHNAVTEGARKYRDTIRRGMKSGYTSADVIFIREVNDE